MMLNLKNKVINLNSKKTLRYVREDLTDYQLEWFFGSQLYPKK